MQQQQQQQQRCCNGGSHVQRRSVAATDATWRLKMNCAFPGPTATHGCSCSLNRQSTPDVWRPFVVTYASGKKLFSAENKH